MIIERLTGNGELGERRLGQMSSSVRSNTVYKSVTSICCTIHDNTSSNVQSQPGSRGYDLVLEVALRAAENVAAKEKFSGANAIASTCRIRFRGVERGWWAAWTGPGKSDTYGYKVATAHAISSQPRGWIESVRFLLRVADFIKIKTRRARDPNRRATCFPKVPSVANAILRPPIMY
ncbi:hypothetical protein B0H17DRAFT_1151815 [Mycena rosella]|uniref:Uncharacterized protein n=1 Tax=Mycena rosella TaxID=1033263 RepID=A0AAD7FFU5_MYCRO|nr:hypothetical protein B0H17DRAFT_1151815 [Mycena rosella]